MKRNHRAFSWKVDVLLYELLFFPSVVLADDCSGLTDCYGTILAAVLAILGLLLLITAPYWIGPLLERFSVSGARRVVASAAQRSRIAAFVARILDEQVLRRLFRIRGPAEPQTPSRERKALREACQCKLEFTRDEPQIAQQGFRSDPQDNQWFYSYVPNIQYECSGQYEGAECSTELTYRWRLHGTQPLGCATIFGSDTNGSAEVRVGSKEPCCFTLSVIVTLKCVAREGDGRIIETSISEECGTGRERFCVSPQGV